jgi:hypothetical protein
MCVSQSTKRILRHVKNITFFHSITLQRHPRRFLSSFSYIFLDSRHNGLYYFPVKFAHAFYCAQMENMTHYPSTMEDGFMPVVVIFQQNLFCLLFILFSNPPRWLFVHKTYVHQIFVESVVVLLEMPCKFRTFLTTSTSRWR